MVFFLEYLHTDNPELYKVANQLFWGSVIAAFLQSDRPKVHDEERGCEAEYYLDTPIAMALLDLSTPENELSASDVCDIIKSSGGILKIHPVTIEEMKTILGSVAQNGPYPGTGIANACTRRKLYAPEITKLLLNLQKELESKGVMVFPASMPDCRRQVMSKYKGKPVGNGVIVLQEGANDCIISNLTVYNNYGSTIEPTTAHQMAIFGRATRTIVINCNVWADGNDALSLWAEGGEGMYYHADLFLRCPGVDFLCPRGWCYATRCRFYGDGRALIWHDGRGNYDKKLVITDSHFDSKSPVTLGRYHHDSQFFLINCTMSDKIIDHPIGYAYTDQVLDPCPWGQRVYIYNVHRRGGDFNWMRNNLDEAKGAPRPEQITPKWTFDGRWDPEARIDSLWDVLAYKHK